VVVAGSAGAHEQQSAPNTNTNKPTRAERRRLVITFASQRTMLASFRPRRGRPESCVIAKPTAPSRFHAAAVTGAVLNEQIPAEGYLAWAKHQIKDDARVFVNAPEQLCGTLSSAAIHAAAECCR
jgi:hypothetical protein